MKETLHVPEEHLADTIAVIEAGLAAVDVHSDVEEALSNWCDDERYYLARLAEDGG